jgi:hypothetical protein
MHKRNEKEIVWATGEEENGRKREECLGKEEDDKSIGER